MERVIVAKKKKYTKLGSASAGGREQLLGRDCSRTSYLIATDNLGVSPHTGIYVPTCIIPSIRPEAAHIQPRPPTVAHVQLMLYKSRQLVRGRF